MMLDGTLSWVLLPACVLVSVAGTAYLAREIKGRSPLAWGIFAAVLQGITLSLPLAAGMLLGLFDPRLWLESGLGRIPPDLFPFLGELSLLAGGATLAVLALSPQHRWKICTACHYRIGWRRNICPYCLTRQPENADGPPKTERLSEIRVFVPADEAEELRRLARQSAEKGSARTLGEDALVARVVRGWISERLSGR